MREDVNIIDIARYAGVSVSTVSRVLNNHPDVSAATRKKVMHVIERHAYIPNNSARNLKRESMKAVGVIVKGFTNPFFIRMLEIIQKELHEWRYLMLLNQVSPDHDELDAAISLVKEKKPRGLLFLGGSFEQRSDRLASLGLPFVMTTSTITKGIDRERFSSVTIDDHLESYKITERMYRSGHQQLAAIGFLPDDRSIGQLRISGFLQALRDQGVDASEAIGYAGEFSMKAGYRATGELLRKTRLSCLFCISDLIALGAIRAIHDAGLRVPEDISVVGFDGIEAGRYSVPSLATVQQPDEEMARVSIQLLMDCLKKGAPHQHRIFEARFLEGESFRPLNTL